MRIGFIGLGNMASAIIGGVLGKEMVEASELMGSDVSDVMRDRAAQKFGMAVTSDNAEAAAWADVLFLAVKPIFLGEVLEGIRDAVREDTIIVSIVAGRTLQNLRDGLGRQGHKIVRCMPNTPALVLEGCTGVCADDTVSAEELERVLTLLGSFGKASVVPERLMDAVVGVSGSSPAYVFLFIEALADGAVLAGMPRAQAYEFAAQSVLGSAKLVLETGKHPGELKDMVCSPGGTTMEAVKVLEEKGFRAAVMDAVEACVNKSKNL